MSLRTLVDTVSLKVANVTFLPSSVIMIYHLNKKTQEFISIYVKLTQSSIIIKGLSQNV
jgi:hypothetical protein